MLNCLPEWVTCGKTTVINGKVYCGGGTTDHDSPDDQYNIIVFCYDPSQDKWTTLPPLPVRWLCLVFHIEHLLVDLNKDLKTSS